jgi:hypothetical protein
MIDIKPLYIHKQFFDEEIIHETKVSKKRGRRGGHKNVRRAESG